MPKEMIHSRWFGRKVLTEDSDGQLVEEIIETSSAKVGWDRSAGYVEMAIVDVDAKVFETPGPYVYLEETAKHMQLDRDAINRLIRALRKARDAAFGADA